MWTPPGAATWFQTHPCGVEVQTARDAIGTDGGFRRTLVGLKCYRAAQGCGGFGRFQTHPCGVEVQTARDAIGTDGVFQTHPCGVEVLGYEVVPEVFLFGIDAVSDAPLWG